MASHSCFHKSVAKAMFSNLSRTEFLGVFRMLREFFFSTRKITLIRMWHKTKRQFSNFFLEFEKKIPYLSLHPPFPPNQMKTSNISQSAKFKVNSGKQSI